MENKEIKVKKYKKAYVEITNACNFNCCFCAPSHRKKQNMTISEFDFLCDEIVPLSDYLYLHVLGEPTVHPQFLQFVSLASKKGLKVNLVSNGASADVIIAALPFLRKAALSVHSAFFNDVDLDEYLKGVKRIVDSRGDTIVELRLFKDTSSLKAVCSALGISVPDFSANESVKIAENFYISVFERFEWKKDGKRDKGCYGLIDQFAVLSDGTVVPCCIDYDGEIDLGNAFTKGLAACLEGERAEKLASGFRCGQIADEVCKRCAFVRKAAKK